MSKGATRLTASRFSGAHGRALLFGTRCARRARGVTARGCERPGGGAEPGRRADRHPERGVCNPRLGAGRRRYRLPDRAHAGRRRQRAHGRVRDRRRLAAATHGHAGLAAVRRGRASRSAAATSGASARASGRRARSRTPSPSSGRPGRSGARVPAPACARTGRRAATRPTRRDVQEIAVHGGARRRERPRAHGRARPHEPDRPVTAPRATAPINMFIIGYPSPPATAAAISNRPAISTTATSTATSRRAASRASSSRACSRSRRTRTCSRSSRTRPC